MDRDDVKAKLRTFICAELLQDANYALTDDQPLITSGMIDSYALAQVGVFVETAFGIYIPDDDLTVENINTLNQATDRVMERLAKN
jgi:acyl carrier protein